MITPTIIQGPAILTYDSVVYYTKGGITESFARTTFPIEADSFGKIDERVQSQRFEISFRPVGEIQSLDKAWPYSLSDIGKSIFGTSDKALVIHTLDGRKITYNKAAVLRMPVLSCRPTDTLFGDMAFVCIGDGVREDADHFRAITSEAFADASFDETLIKTAIYDGAWGSSPYDSIGSLEGFEFEQIANIVPVTADDVGEADLILQSLDGRARFRPSNLTQAQVDTMFLHQGTGALAPGESIAKAGTDLVVTSSALHVTLHNAGPVNMNSRYALGEHVHGVLEFGSKRSFTSGVGDDLFTLAVQ